MRQCHRGKIQWYTAVTVKWEERMFQWHDNTIKTMMVQSVSMEKTLRWNEGYDVILQFQSKLF